MKFYNSNQLNWWPITPWRNSWNVLLWLYRIFHSYLHTCCIVDGITLYEFEGESITIRTLSVEFIVINFNKKNIISLHDLLVCQYTLSTCQQTLSFNHKIQYINIFPRIFPSRSLCPWPTSCPSWEYHGTRHQIFNCFDSCSIVVLTYLYRV